MGYGPPYRIDGPLPQRPVHTLLDVARIVDDVDSQGIERWGNGVTVYPYSDDLPGIWDTCNHGGTLTKAAGTTVPHPDFDAFTVHLGQTCSSLGIWGAGLSETEAQTRYNARIKAAFAANEAWAVEKEFMGGGSMGNNPHLADGNGTISTTAVSVTQAVVALENLIAATGKEGVIHMSPGAAVIARDHWVVADFDKSGNLTTVNGTPVVPGYGYVGVSQPAGKTAPTATQEYIYATGPIEIRRSELMMLPETVAEALNRASNTITYQSERFYVVDWDTVFQAAVRADRSLG